MATIEPSDGKQSTGPSLLASIAFCEAVGIVPGALTRDEITNWYATLEKPDRTPPDWVFGPVWTTLYLLMGISLYLLRREQSGARRSVATALFVLQLGLNALWTMVFFGRRSPLGGLFVIFPLVFAIFGTILAVATVNRRAAALLVPYLLWSAFASTLNFDVWRLNR